MNYLKSHFKNRIREYRKKNGYTQLELALRSGTSRNTISSLETGVYQPTAKLAAALCIALGCSFEQLFYFDNGGN